MNNKRQQMACFVLALAVSPTVFAQQNEYRLGLELGAATTDNISRAPDTALDPAVDETILTGGLNFHLNRDARRWNADFRGSALRHSYQDNTFDDETLATVNGSANFVVIDEKLNWNLRANHGQQLIDPFQPVTPLNREDVTYVTTGPQLTLPVGARTAITASATWSDIRYEFRPFDNERLGGRIGIRRDIAPTKSLSLNVGVSEVEYDLAALFTPIDRINAYLGYSVDDSRNTFSAKFGWSELERDGETADGMLLELDWRRILTGSTTVNLNLGSKYSTNGDIFRLNQRLDGVDRGTQDVQDIDDPFRHDYVRLGYIYKGSRTTLNFGLHFDQERYESFTAFDREIGGLFFNARRELTPNMSGSAFGRFTTRNYSNSNGSDDNITVGLSLNWNASRTVSLRLSGEHRQRDATGFGADYDENRIGLTLHFVPIDSRY